MVKWIRKSLLKSNLICLTNIPKAYKVGTSNSNWCVARTMSFKGGKISNEPQLKKFQNFFLLLL